MKNTNDVLIFETNILDGPIKFSDFLYTYAPDFDSMQYHQKINTLRELHKKHEEHILKVGERYGFDGEKLIISSCDGLSTKEKEYFEVDKSLSLENKNLLKQKIFSDIVLIKKDTKQVAVGYTTSDDPVVIIEDKENGVTVLASCSTSKISNRIPIHMLNILKEEFNSNINNLKVYISSNLKMENNKILYKPKSIKNNPKVWKGCIKKIVKVPKGSFIQKTIMFATDIIGYNIDRESAIVKMLTSSGIDINNITINSKNTYSSLLFSSTKAKNLREDGLSGSYLVGVYYPNDTKLKHENKGRTRVLK